MRNLNINFAVCLFLMPLLTAGCRKDPADTAHDDNAAPAEFHITITTGHTTRTSFDRQNGEVSWVTGDELAVIFATVGGGFDPGLVGTATVRVTEDAAELDAVFPAASLPAGDDWQIFALYPKTAFDGCTSDSLLCRLPEVQTSDANGIYDTAAALLRGYTDVRSGEAAAGERLSMTFEHIVSYGEMTVIPSAMMAGSDDAPDIKIAASQPLSGGFGLAADGTVSVGDANGGICIKGCRTSQPLMFAVLPCELSDTELTVTAEYDDCLITKNFHPSEFRFRRGVTSAFKADMQDADIAAAAGAVLWSESFESVEEADLGYTTLFGAIQGRYDPTGASSSCKLFRDTANSSLTYAGSYGAYISVSGSTKASIDGKAYATNNSDGNLTVSGIGLFGARKLRLTFGTTASACKIETSFDGSPYSAKEGIEFDADDGQFSHYDFEAPQGAQELSLRISSNTSIQRIYDNFTLTVRE